MGIFDFKWFRKRRITILLKKASLLAVEVKFMRVDDPRFIRKAQKLQTTIEQIKALHHAR